MIQFSVVELKAIMASLTGSRVFRPKPGAWTGQQQLALIDKINAEVTREEDLQKQNDLHKRLAKLRADLDRVSPGWREPFAELLAVEEEDYRNEPRQG